MPAFNNSISSISKNPSQGTPLRGTGAIDSNNSDQKTKTNGRYELADLQQYSASSVILLDSSPPPKESEEKFVIFEAPHVEEDHQPATPYLFVDVNIGDKEPVRIAVYDGDTAEDLAEEFDRVH